MKAFRQIVAFSMLGIVLAGASSALLWGRFDHMALAIVAVVFMLFYLIVTMDVDDPA